MKAIELQPRRSTLSIVKRLERIRLIEYVLMPSSAIATIDPSLRLPVANFSLHNMKTKYGHPFLSHLPLSLSLATAQHTT